MRIQKKKEKLLEADLTPMIDMTFQLIAFFMVLANFSKVDQNQLIVLPASELAKPPDDVERYNLTLNLTGPPKQPDHPPEGTVILAGENIPIDALGPRLQSEVTTARNQNFELSEINVIIRADENSRALDLQELIKKCQDNQLTTFALRVQEDVN